MAADALVTEGAKVSAGMILTLLTKYISYPYDMLNVEQLTKSQLQINDLVHGCGNSIANAVKLP